MDNQNQQQTHYIIAYLHHMYHISHEMKRSNPKLNAPSTKYSIEQGNLKANDHLIQIPILNHASAADRVKVRRVERWQIRAVHCAQGSVSPRGLLRQRSTR